MTACRRCHVLKVKLAEAETDLRGAARVVAEHPGNPQWNGIAAARKADRDELRGWIEQHEAECMVPATKPKLRTARDVVRPKPKPKKRKRTVIDREAMAAALAVVPPAPPSGMPRPPRAASEPSRLDAGSNCRECGKWLPGERILCGRCFVKVGRP